MVKFLRQWFCSKAMQTEHLSHGSSLCFAWKLLNLIIKSYHSIPNVWCLESGKCDEYCLNSNQKLSSLKIIHPWKLQKLCRFVARVIFNKNGGKHNIFLICGKVSKLGTKSLFVGFFYNIVKKRRRAFAIFPNTYLILKCLCEIFFFFIKPQKFPIF